MSTHTTTNSTLWTVARKRRIGPDQHVGWLADDEVVCLECEPPLTPEAPDPLRGAETARARCDRCGERLEDVL